MPVQFHDEMPLGIARDHLRTMVDVGHECPCCKQFAKVYERVIHATMARELILLYRNAPAAPVGFYDDHGSDWFHLPTLLGHNGGDVTKCRYWGLLKEDDRRREDGGRAGYWRLTGLGADFVNNGRLLGLSGDEVGIRDCLGTKFDYSALMQPAVVDADGDPVLFPPPRPVLGDVA